MVIRRNIQFALKRRTYNGKKVFENLPIRMRVSYNSLRLDILTGFFVDEENWDPEQQRVKKNTFGKNKQPATQINAYLSRAEYEMNEVFKEFEVIDRHPKPAELEEAFQSRMQGTNLSSKKKTEKNPKFWAALNRFKVEQANKNAWKPGTIQKFNALGNHIRKWKEQPRFEDFDENGLTSFLTSLRDVEELTNATILKNLDYLKWFFRWAAKAGYHNCMAFQDYKPNIPATRKKIIFFTIDELRKMEAYEIPESKKYLERVRDVFIFCCFTGLRYSDVCNLRRGDIKEDYLDITTVKTDDPLRIELNDVSRRILDKYKDEVFPKNKALPVISNQKMNDYLKELCRLAGFDEEIRITEYHGAERFDLSFPKHALVGTHQGRKSFICNALAQGIPVNVVMKWTGHSTYKSMKPYVEVADTIKAREMAKLNHLL